MADCSENFLQHDFTVVVIEGRSMFRRAQVAVIFCRRCGKNGPVGALGESVTFDPWDAADSQPKEPT